MEPQYVVTLVHGTWPDTNGWVTAGSFLRRELERTLGHTAFREFWWAGTNRHGARTEGGIRLAEFIRAGRADYPAARHFIIAHSHGGNVALYAMRDPAARMAIDGIITLGTPFLHARRRDPQRHAAAIAWLTLTATALWAFMILDALALPAVALWWLPAAGLAIVEAKPALARWLTETARLEQSSIVAAIQPPCVERSKLLVLCARDDEAGRWLRAWEVMAHGPFVIGCVLLALVELALRSNVPGLVDELAERILDQGLDRIGFVNVDGGAFWGVLIILCAICGAALMFSSLLRWPGYGREPLLVNVLVDMRTKRTPEAAGDAPHTPYTFDVSACAPEHQAAKGLRHTAICSDPAIVSAMRDWIAGGVRPGVDAPVAEKERARSR